MAEITPALSDEAVAADASGGMPAPQQNAQLAALVQKLRGDSALPGGGQWGAPPPDNSILSQLSRLPSNIARAVSGWLDKSGQQASNAGAGGSLGDAAAAPPAIRPALSAPAAPGSPSVASAAPAPAAASGGPALTFGGPELQSAEAASPVAAAPAAVPATDAPRKTLPEIYQDMMSRVNPTINRGLTPEQQAASQKNFYLNLAAQTGNGPTGPNAFSRFGNAGLDQQKYEGAQQAINTELEKLRLTNARDDAKTVTTLGDKENDNERADKQLAVLQKHYETSDAQLAEHMKILREQLAQGKFDIKATPKGYVMIDKKSGATKFMTGPDGKPIMPHEPGSTPSAEERMLDKTMHDPAAMEAYLKMHKATGEAPEIGIAKIAATMVDKDMTGKTTFADAMATIDREMAKRRGDAATTAAPAKPSTQAQASIEAKAAIAQGKDPKAVNDRLKSWGYEPV